MLTELIKNSMNDILITWDDSFLTDIEVIDKQHYAMVNLVNNLYSAFIGNKISEISTSEALDEAEKYIKFHFKTEEDYFEKIDYQGSQIHIGEHKKFINQISNFKQAFYSENQNISLQLMFYLKDWIIEHILYYDKQYINDLRNHGL